MSEQYHYPSQDQYPPPPQQGYYPPQPQPQPQTIVVQQAPPDNDDKFCLGW
ncbi:hypothetical protein Glove_144g88 [Diversispora epigaea]|uniref:Cysteine-rich transmembrane CYSTM domain-containing protein n=1 Tax=Diversispora epigaea TaxID=1348612 RepID=A0A397J3Y2_9GLOM|nr:hypothetical protein Glove_144g88 [Diversispora epigaea]